MPSFCCVPKCSQKGYKRNGNPVSFFNFPKDQEMCKKWIIAIRRDVGKDFKLNERTKICSLHFNSLDLHKSLNGRIYPVKGAVPSVFAWSVCNKSRKSPKARNPLPTTTCTTSKKLDTDDSESECSIVEQTVKFDEENPPAPPEHNTTEELLELRKSLEDLRIQLDNCRKRNSELENENTRLNKALKDLQNIHDTKIFTLERFSSVDNEINFYTGFPNYETYEAVLEFLNPGVHGENIRYWKRDVEDGFYDDEEEADDDEDCESENVGLAKRGRPRKLKPNEEFFIVMCRLRRGFSERHLANLYGVSQSHISRLLIAWINHMFLKCGAVNIWPSRAAVDEDMPEDFKAKYPSTRVIIDCTEIQCEMPSSLLLNSELFSSYKHRVTLKGLVGISPDGSKTFISQLYTGSISDVEIVTRSGFLDLEFKQGDSIMADKGFTVGNLLPLGVEINIPPFLGSDQQMSPEEVLKTQEIASLRIHIERAINKIKIFLIWKGPVPISNFGLVNQMWTVCGFLCNFQNPIISI